MTWGRPTVVAEVGDGFWATEAAAHQDAVEMALGRVKPGTTVDLAAVRLASDAPGVVVVVWRNRNIGIVPVEERDGLLAQLAAAGRAHVVSPARIVGDGALWRVWVGPGGPDSAEAASSSPPPTDTIAPKPLNIAGIPLQRRD